MKYLITFLIVLYIPIVALSQEQEIKPFDPTQINTAVSLDGHRYDLFEGEIYQLRVKGQYGFAENRHQFALSVPYMTSDKFSGIERQTGIGDVRVNYLFKFKDEMDTEMPKSFAFGLDFNIPTGDVDAGHGIGAVVISPVLHYAVWPVPTVAAFLSARYAHSTKYVEGAWWGGGTIPGGDPNLEPKVRDLMLDAKGLIQIGDGGWLSISANYVQYIDEKDYTINIVPELGKIWNQKFSLHIQSVVWLGGRKKAKNITSFHLRYFL
jgi:hypothetical protein